MTGLDPDAELAVDATAYVEAVYKAEAAENTAPPPGVAGRVVAAILLDDALVRCVRDWVERRHALEASMAPPQPPPIDECYRRVRALLREAEVA